MNAFKNKIHERALRVAREFKRVEAEVISVLQEVEESKLFLDFELSSLHQYAVEKMGLSRDVASNFILAARKTKQIPILQEAFQEGSVSVSQIRKAASVLTLEKQEDWPLWIDRMKTCTSTQLEREVARENPNEAIPERMKYVSGERLELRLGITQEMSEQLRRIQDLECKRTKKFTSLEDAIKASADAYLEKHDPLKKAERVLSQKVIRPGRMDRVIRSGKTIPARQKHQAIMRDQGQCTHAVNGKRCENKRWTEIHHIVPRASGGDHSLENLTTLCSAHHKIAHRVLKKNLGPKPHAFIRIESDPRLSCLG